MPTQCATCPFREGGWRCVEPLLIERALTEGSPICHSTGKALTKRLGKAKICRGARDLQLRYFHQIGFIEAPTDQAWEKKCQTLKL